MTTFFPGLAPSILVLASSLAISAPALAVDVDAFFTRPFQWDARRVPEILSLVGQLETITGPNCFSTGLFLKGILPVNRVMDTPEIDFWMTSPLCTKLSDLRETELGDFGFVPARHLFLILDRTRAFEKECYTKGCPYRVRAISEILPEFVPGTPRRSVAYYRCTDAGSLQRKHAEALGPDFFKLDEEIRALEIEALTSVRYFMEPRHPDHAATRSVRLDLLARVDGLVARARIVASFHPDGEPAFLCQSLLVRLDGIRQQIWQYSLISGGKVT
jgi:hypothetical protein